MKTRNKTNTNSDRTTQRQRQDSLTDSPDKDTDSDSTLEPGMFSGLTAWYSTSVKDSTIKSWVDGDGELVTSDTAMFLFSEDAEAPDTKRIFESEAYTNEFVSIFHADVMTEFLRQGHMKKVALGKYFLPPKEVHDVIKQQVSFKWEMNAQRARPAKPAAQHKSPSPHKDTAAGSTVTSPPRIEDVSQRAAPRVTSNAPSTSQSSTSSHNQQPQASTSHQPTSPQVSTSQARSTSRAMSPQPSTSRGSAPGTVTVQHSQTQHWALSPSHAGTASHQSRKRVSINEESAHPELGYVDIDQFPKVKGALNDFTFGQHGCQVVNK